MTDAQLRDLLAESPIVAPGVRNRFDAVLSGDGPTWWTVELGGKDARLALDIAADRDLAAAPWPETAFARRRHRD